MLHKVCVSFDVDHECLGTRFLKAMIQPYGKNTGMDLYKQIIVKEDFLCTLLLSREILVLLVKGFTNSKLSTVAEEIISRGR